MMREYASIKLRSLLEAEDKLRALERAYQETPTLENLRTYNVSRIRAGKFPVFDLNYGNMMLAGIKSLLQNARSTTVYNRDTVEGVYKANNVAHSVTAIVHQVEKPQEVLRVSFGANIPSILFDVHLSDGKSAYFSSRRIQHAVSSQWYLSGLSRFSSGGAPTHYVHPNAAESWIYSPQGMLKWLNKELIRFTQSGSYGVPSEDIIETFDARLRTLERAWSTNPSQRTLERYVLGLLRSGDGPHEIVWGNKVLRIRIEPSPWNSGKENRDLIFFSVEEDGMVTTKGWGPNMHREVREAALSMFESLTESDARLSRLLTKVRGPHGDAHDLARLHQLARQAGQRVYWLEKDPWGNVDPEGGFRIVAVFDNIGEILKHEPTFKWDALTNFRHPVEDEPLFRIQKHNFIRNEIYSFDIYRYRELFSDKDYSLYLF